METSPDDSCVCPVIFDPVERLFTLSCRLCQKEIRSAKEVLEHKCRRNSTMEERRNVAKYGVMCKTNEVKEKTRRTNSLDLDREDLKDHYRRCHKIVVSDSAPLAKRSRKTVLKDDLGESFYCHLCKTNFVGHGHFVQAKHKTQMQDRIETPDMDVFQDIKEEFISEEQEQEEDYSQDFEPDVKEFEHSDDEETSEPKASVSKGNVNKSTKSPLKKRRRRSRKKKAHAIGQFEGEEEEEEESNEGEEGGGERVKCEHCDQTFKSVRAMHVHSGKSHGRRDDGSSTDFVCQICFRALKNAASFRHHRETLHSATVLRGEVFRCELCEKDFTNASYAKAHARRTHRECDKCGVVVENAHRLKEHMWNVHADYGTLDPLKGDDDGGSSVVKDEGGVRSVEKSTDGTVCGLRYPTAHLIQRRQEEGELKPDPILDLLSSSTFTCKVCEASFDDAKTLDDHTDMVHGCRIDDVHWVKCPACFKRFKSEASLAEHVKKFHGKDDVRCPQCEFRGPKHYLIEHVRRSHLNEAHRCPTCGKVLKSRQMLNVHIRTFHKSSNVCDLCGKTFSSSSSLRSHVKNTHERKEKLRRAKEEGREGGDSTIPVKKCPQCDHVSYSKHSIRIHVRLVHDKIKDFECQQCGDRFSQKGNLKAHLRRNHVEDDDVVMDEKTGKRIFPCEICGQKCTTRGGLTKHMDIRHGVKRLLLKEEGTKRKEEERVVVESMEVLPASSSSC